MKTKIKKPHNQIWDDKLYFRIWDLARNGHGNKKIVRILGIKIGTLRGWLKTKPALKWGLQELRNQDEETFPDYVYKRLPPNLKELWDELQTLVHGNSYQKINMLFDRHGIRARQQIWIHALMYYHFNASKACRFVNITSKDVDRWKKDVEFGELINEIDWHKKNLGEESLMKLVRQGNESAVLFFNRTKNKDRGYSDKVVIEGEVKHHHDHQVTFVLEDLELRLETKKEILEAIRLKKSKEEALEGRIIEGESRAHLEYNPGVNGKEQDYDSDSEEDPEVRAAIREREEIKHLRETYPAKKQPSRKQKAIKQSFPPRPKGYRTDRVKPI